MNDILHDPIMRNLCLCYMDDVLTHAPTLLELIKRTLYVLSIFAEHDLYCKPSKCQFHVQSLEYLGLILSPGKISTDPTKVSGIQEWPTPLNLHDVRSFTGFTNYYRRFIPKYATICQPLDDLKRKNQPFKWTPECQQAFDSLKSMFLEYATLLLPNSFAPFYLETDASAFASGAVLYQLDDDNQLKPCGYISQRFTPTERNYQIYDRELFAIIRALNTWRHYLLGSPFPVQVYCDHANLQYWREPQRLSPRQARWHLLISQFP